MKDVLTTLRKYIAENILFSENGYPFSDEDSFIDNGIIDSMNILELISFVEERFGIKVVDHEIIPENFDSIDRLATYVESKVQTTD